jgi:hypothetical protein
METELEDVMGRLHALDFARPTIDSLRARVLQRRRRRRVASVTALVFAFALGIAGLALAVDRHDRGNLTTEVPITTTRPSPPTTVANELNVDELARPPFTIDQNGVQFVANGDDLYAFAATRLYRLSLVTADATWVEVTSALPDRFMSNIVVFDTDRAFVIDGSGSAGPALAELDLRRGQLTPRGRVAGEFYAGASDGRYVYFVSARDTIRFDTTSGTLDVTAAPSAVRAPTMTEVLADGNVFAAFLGTTSPFAFLDPTTLEWRGVGLFPGYAAVYIASHAGSERAVTLALRRNDGLRTFVATLARRDDTPALVELATQSGDTSGCIIPAVAYSASTGVVGISCSELARITPAGPVPAGSFPRDEPYRFISGKVVVVILNQSNRLLRISAG